MPPPGLQSRAAARMPRDRLVPGFSPDGPPSVPAIASRSADAARQACPQLFAWRAAFVPATACRSADPRDRLAPNFSLGVPPSVPAIVSRSADAARMAFSGISPDVPPSGLQPRAAVRMPRDRLAPVIRLTSGLPALRRAKKGEQKKARPTKKKPKISRLRKIV